MCVFLGGVFEAKPITSLQYNQLTMCSNVIPIRGEGGASISKSRMQRHQVDCAYSLERDFRNLYQITKLLVGKGSWSQCVISLQMEMI